MRCVADQTESPWYLDDLDVLTDRREHALGQPVELVKAAPGAALHQPLEDAPHGRHVKLPVAVEHQHGAAERHCEGLDRLGLAGACWAVWVATVAHRQRLCKRVSGSTVYTGRTLVMVKKHLSVRGV